MERFGIIGGVIVSYCQNCGQEMDPNKPFCTKCGAKKQKETSTVQPEARNAKSSGFFTKGKKALLVTFVIVAIALFGGYKFVESSNKPTKIVSNFAQALKSNDAAEVAVLLNQSHSDLKVDKQSAKQVISYFKENPDILSDVLKQLRSEAIAHEQGQTVIPSKESFLTIEEVEKKKWLIFNQYALSSKLFYIEVTANQDKVTVEIDGQKVGSVKSEKASTFGPYLFGEHTIKATYKDEYAAVEDEQIVSFEDAKEDKQSVELDLTGDQVYVYSDYDDAILFVNDKNTKLKVGDIYEFGPVKTDGSIKLHAEYKGKKSDVVAIEAAEEDIYLEFPYENEEVIAEPEEVEEFDEESDSSDITSVVNNHYMNISNGNYSNAYDLFASSRKGKVAFDGWQKGLKANYNNIVHYADLEEVNGNKAVVSFSMTSYDEQEDGSTLVQEWGGQWYLVKEASGWKLETPEIEKLDSRVE
nr:zinc-ribbon domain-containing protein [Metabacillus iocasae]